MQALIRRLDVLDPLRFQQDFGFRPVRDDINQIIVQRAQMPPQSQWWQRPPTRHHIAL